MDTELHDTMQILKKYNQEHLLNFYDELTEPEKETLLSQIHNIDFDKINIILEREREKGRLFLKNSIE